MAYPVSLVLELVPLELGRLELRAQVDVLRDDAIVRRQIAHQLFRILAFEKKKTVLHQSGRAIFAFSDVYCVYGVSVVAQGNGTCGYKRDTYRCVGVIAQVLDFGHQVFLLFLQTSQAQSENML